MPQSDQPADLRLPDLSEVPPDQVGAALVDHFVERWDGDETMTAVLRAGVTNPAAAERMRELFAEQLATVVATLVTATPTGGQALSPERRAGLVASQMLGLALTRYVLPFPPIAALDRTALVTWVGPTIQRYLVGQP